MKMSKGPLSPDEVARYRTVSQLSSANQARVAELCERQVQESIAQKSQSTSAMLGSLRPLNVARTRGPVHKPAPSAKDSTGTCPTPATGKKAPPPKLGADRPPVVKPPPQRSPTAPPKGQGAGAKSLPIQSAIPAPLSPKRPSRSHLEGKVVSPRGNPPPRVAPNPVNPSRASSAAGCANSKKSGI